MNKEGMIAFQVFKESVKGPDYCGFVCRLNQFISWSEKGEEFVLIMDNASIHKTLLLKENFLNKVNAIYTPPYTPELNAIEELFAKWKLCIRKEQPQTEEDLIKALVKTSKLISENDCKGFIKHSLAFFEQCFEKKSFYSE